MTKFKRNSIAKLSGAPSLCASVLLCFCASISFALTGAVQAEPPIIVGNTDQEIKKVDLDVFTKVTGLTTAQDTYDVYAPFDGRVEDVMVELLDLVKADAVIARMVSSEMAALLDSSGEDSRKQTEKHWQGVYEYYSVKAESPGIVTNVYVKPKTRVYKGDRLFTVAKKVAIIGKNTEKLYASLAPGMTAELVYKKKQRYKT